MLALGNHDSLLLKAFLLEGSLLLMVVFFEFGEALLIVSLQLRFSLLSFFLQVLFPLLDVSHWIFFRLVRNLLMSQIHANNGSISDEAEFSLIKSLGLWRWPKLIKYTILGMKIKLN